METQARSIAKALSYRILGSCLTGVLVYFFSGNLKVSFGVGAMDMIGKIGLYWLHERIWNLIPLGRQRPPEYEI